MKVFSILIADQNPNIREFLRRELVSAGHAVQEAKDGREVMAITFAESPPDLLILDMDLPYVSGLTVLQRLQDKGLALPVIVHTLDTEWMEHPAVQKVAAFWEKSGNNIEGFMAMVEEVLKKRYLHKISFMEELLPGKRERSADG
jgi:DNA-binding response OmpR family regulator